MQLYNFKLFHTQGIHRRLCIIGLCRFRNNYLQEDRLCSKGFLERNIQSQATHKIMYYVTMWIYRLLQFINYIVYEHTTINKNTDQVFCDYITLNYSIHRAYTEDYVLCDYVDV